MECDRATMFPFFAPPSPPDGSNGTAKGAIAAATTPKHLDRLHDHVVKQSERLGERAGLRFCEAVYFRSNDVAP